MEKIHFSIHINAPVEKVWDTMLSDETYREWTNVFHPGSYYKGSWDAGSEMLFLGPEGGGMASRIAENRLHEFISIEHVGMIKDGVRDTESEEAKKWVSAFENYTFAEKDGGTELSVAMDTNEEYKAMFEGLWPKALQALKEIAER